MLKIHFIAIGGAAMHNLALALHQLGHQITGSDDEIFEPSKSRLDAAGILPKDIGWFPSKIDSSIDAIILGMHARKDNPELIKAQELNIPIFSYPEYIYESTKNKKRIVIGGSHGKTTITSMIMYVVNSLNKEFDYLVGSQIDGFKNMVNLSDKSQVAVIEGDEYLASILNPVPKFHLYYPNVAIISGIAWDHINVFPTFEYYCEQFEIFIEKIESNGVLIYCEKDVVLKTLIEKKKRDDITYIPYSLPDYEIINETTYIKHNGKNYQLKVFGEHNLMNLLAAKYACNQIGVQDDEFYSQISSFKGAAKRLELIQQSNSCIVYKDFAHSPSKLKATIEAIKSQYPSRKIIAFMELHTFSSLNKTFLREYNSCMNDADFPYVFYSPKTIEHKKLAFISKEDILKNFNTTNLKVIDTNDELISEISTLSKENTIFLMMSSGNWNGVDVFQLLR